MAIMKMTVFSDVALRSSLKLITLLMKAANTSETLDMFYHYMAQHSRRQSSPNKWLPHFLVLEA